MDIVPYGSPNSLECIHCDICVKVCPRKAITIVDTGNFTKGTD
ncbi:MAG: 4Fe-4S binding protein [Clostridiales Family XIII bacterium]|nr:4Fe-4S binding protein [Clostridiales Family XIII bacterium]